MLVMVLVPSTALDSSPRWRHVLFQMAPHYHSDYHQARPMAAQVLMMFKVGNQETPRVSAKGGKYKNTMIHTNQHRTGLSPATASYFRVGCPRLC